MKKILLNLIASIVILAVLITAVMLALRSYTRQNQSIEVPNVKGLTINNAMPLIESSQLTYDIIDSIFDKRGKPGTIKESVPAAGTKVKQGRKMYLTIYAYNAETGIIPSVTDISLRQVTAMLEGLGFESVKHEYVSGAYKDLVVELRANGKILTPGERVPLSAPLRIMVSNGSGRSSATEEGTFELSENESWF